MAEESKKCPECGHSESLHDSHGCRALISTPGSLTAGTRCTCTTPKPKA